MKIGIIGSGGREHALCYALKKSKQIEEIYCFPGNAGTNDISKNVDIDLNNFNLILSLNQQSYVQFLHRNLAYFITLIAIILGLKLYFINKSEYFKNYLVVLIILFIQILLGVFTLISGLNLYLASFHQITSILLVFTVINLNYKLS